VSVRRLDAEQGRVVPDGCEITRCICGADDCRVLIERVPSGCLVRCNVCGMHYANPRLLRRLVRQAAGKAIEPQIDEDKILEPDRWEKTFAFRLAVLNKHAPAKGRLLDIGCYAGFLLRKARDDGWEAFGVEPSVSAARYARERFGLDVQVGTLEEARCKAGTFDALGLFEVIEHVPDPNSVLMEAHRVLKPGGLLLVETPTIDNWLYKVLRGKWRHFISAHFWFFSERTLLPLLEKHGFRAVEVTRVGRHTSVRHLIAVLSQHFRPLAKAADLLLVRLFHLGGVTIYLNLRDNMLIAARKKD